MLVVRRDVRGLLLGVFAGTSAWLATGSQAQVTSLEYDPGLGTLPSSQGFTHVNIPAPGPALIVENNVLKQDTRGYRQMPSNRAGYQWFRGSLAPADFVDGLVISMELKVISSSYDPDFVGLGGVDSRNAGYGIGAIDDLGRIITLGIAENGVFLNNEINILEAAGSPFFPFDTTDAPHEYQLTISALGASLSIDGAAALDLSLGATDQIPRGMGFVGFGDVFDDRASVPTESVTELGRFAYTVVPEPAGLFGLVVLTIALRRRVGSR